MGGISGTGFADLKGKSKTLDGFIPLSFRDGADPNPPPVEEFVADVHMVAFEARLREHAKKLINGSSAAFSEIPLWQAREEVLQGLHKSREFALEYAWSEGSRSVRERSVRYWRIFCLMLGLPEVITSYKDAWQLQYFASFMGLIWKKRNGDVGLAASTVEQQVSQVRVWLSEEFGVRVLDWDRLTQKVVSGLKKRKGSGLGVMHKPHVTYRFQQVLWKKADTPMSRLFADMSSMRFIMLRRISEMASTTGHNVANKTSRNLLQRNCSLESMVKFWGFWPLTKNSVNLLRGVDASMGDIFHRLMRRYLDNLLYLAQHPEQDPDTLTFFHLHGRPITRQEVEKEEKRTCLLAFTSEPGIGHLDPALYRYNTHSDRKGGAVWMLDTVTGIEFYVRYMGDWKSLAFYTYGRCSKAAAAGVERTLGRALAALFA